MKRKLRPNTVNDTHSTKRIHMLPSSLTLTQMLQVHAELTDHHPKIEGDDDIPDLQVPTPSPTTFLPSLKSPTNGREWKIPQWFMPSATLRYTRSNFSAAPPSAANSISNDLPNLYSFLANSLHSAPNPNSSPPIAIQSQFNQLYKFIIANPQNMTECQSLSCQAFDMVAQEFNLQHPNLQELPQSTPTITTSRSPRKISKRHIGVGAGLSPAVPPNPTPNASPATIAQVGALLKLDPSAETHPPSTTDTPISSPPPLDHAAATTTSSFTSANGSEDFHIITTASTRPRKRRKNKV